MQFLDVVKQKGAQFVSENATVLLTAGGVVGTVATAVLTGRAGFKAAEIIREKELEHIHPSGVTDVISEEGSTMGLTTADKVKLVWPHFVPPVLTGSLTIGAIIFSHRMSAQKAAALAAAYGLAERNLSEYKEKVSEKLTKPKKEALEEEISQDRVNRTGGYQNIVVIEGEVLCFDEPTGRYFQSTMEKIQKAVNDTNTEILNDRGWVNATAFYERLGLPATSWTDDMGWNTDAPVDLKYDTVIAPNGKPCLSIDFQVLPKPDYIPKHY